jgi:hypothetical protein
MGSVEFTVYLNESLSFDLGVNRDIMNVGAEEAPHLESHQLLEKFPTWRIGETENFYTSF